jgi:hypothetical protein
MLVAIRKRRMTSLLVGRSQLARRKESLMNQSTPWKRSQTGYFFAMRNLAKISQIANRKMSDLFVGLSVATTGSGGERSLSV